MGFERRNIQGMEGYTPGEQPGDSNTIKLNTNENPYPPSPRVASAVREFSSASLRRYPPQWQISSVKWLHHAMV